MQYTCQLDDSIASRDDVNIIQQADGVILTAKPVNKNRAFLWDVNTGTELPGMHLPVGTQLYPTPDGNNVNVFKQSRMLQTIRVDSGEIYSEVAFDQGRVRQVEVTNRYAAFTFDQSVGPVVIDIKARILIHRFQYQARSVAISGNEKYLVTNNNCCLAIHSLPMLERVCVTEVSHAPELITFSKDPTKFFVMDSACELKSVRVNIPMRKAAVSEILRDLEMKDFRLSHSERLLLVRASRCLYVINTNKETMSHRIVNMPEGVFCERLSTFRDASFSPNDEYVLAVRHIYLGVWCARSGKPVRLLHQSISPLMKMFAFDAVNRAVTIAEDKTMQVCRCFDTIIFFHCPVAQQFSQSTHISDHSSLTKKLELISNSLPLVHKIVDTLFTGLEPGQSRQ